MFYHCNFIILGYLWMCFCMCVNARVPSCIVSVCPAGWLAERLKLIVLSSPLWCLQGGKEPAGLPTIQTTAGRVSVCRAGAHPRAHPGLRQEGRAALQMPRFCQFAPSWTEGCREEWKGVGDTEGGFAEKLFQVHDQLHIQTTNIESETSQDSRI